MTVQTLIICDSDVGPSEYWGCVYRWSGYEEKGSIYSLLRYVESHGDRLRRKYLEWIHDLGESVVGDKRIVDHLVFEDGFSYWWMTLFVEQNPWKSPSIIDAIRFFALEEIIIQRRPDKVRLVSANRILHEVLSGLCQNMDIGYEWEQLPDRPLQRLSFRVVYHALPQFMQASISLIHHLFARWPFRQVNKSDWFAGERSLFICAFFFHIDHKVVEEGRFRSRYWEDLHGLMERLNLSGNWLQLYYPHNAVPTPKVAMSFVQRFNQQKQKEGIHVFLDAYLSWRIIGSVIRRWFKLMFISWHMGGLKCAFRPRGTQFSLWPLMKRDWLGSMRGATAINNLLWLELFDAALEDLPHQKQGLYLCENQSWERALIRAWRKHGHGQLIAVAHSTVRFWDLRYFHDPRTVQARNHCPIPEPDLVALNSEAAVNAYLEMGYPRERIFECEALRYGYLNNLKVGCLSRTRKDGDRLKVLVLGDFTPSGTLSLLSLLEEAAIHISISVEYTIKPHPNYIVRAEDYVALPLKVVTSPLFDILKDYDVVLSGNLTSASVEAYCAGLRVIVAIDAAELNYSPLRGRKNVKFVCTPDELVDALESSSQSTINNSSDDDNFFFLDAGLPRWQRLLSSVVVN
ncbi:MAG: hypothetical protein HY272_11535 [Gammaproteobacteria bacterium]|nr:hypothetical protein [Gammaproteobacteria bacterium]